MEKIKAMRDDYWKWILDHSIEDAAISQLPNGNLRILSEFATGQVNSYELEDGIIAVELRILIGQDDETVFFLHFELKDMDYAKRLFYEMAECYEEQRTRHRSRILLSCTSAMTTTFVSQKLNQAAKTSGKNYQFDAIAFPLLLEKAFDYDTILLAPQIAYEAQSIQKLLPDRLVLLIPPKLFATYDAPAILEFVRKEQDKFEKKKKEQREASSVAGIHNNANVLSIAILTLDNQRFQINYRLYRNGKPEHEDFVIKLHANIIDDLCDILDTAYYLYSHYDCIGITMPGIIRDGRVDLPTWLDKNFDLKGFLEEKYHVPVFIKNNANAAAMGYYICQNMYKNLVFFSQPSAYRYGGAGLVMDGRLIEGSHFSAGEMKFSWSDYKDESSDQHSLVYKPKKTLLILEQYLRNIIAVVDPELILIRNKLVGGVDEIIKHLGETIPKEYLPELVLASDEDSLDLMLVGMMQLCLDAMEAKN